MPQGSTTHPEKTTQALASARFVWVDVPVNSRNLFVSFELSFETPQEGPLWLHVFSDTRYRIFLNSRFLAYGPPRFITRYPEYDSYDLFPHLSDRIIHLRVEVNFYGTSSFQSMPDGRPGFICSGGSADGRIKFATPGMWKARVHEAWNAHAPLFSFAQNPAEICDLRKLRSELSIPATLPPIEIPASDLAWSPPCQRSVAMPPAEALHPQILLAAGPLQNGRKLLCLQSNDPGFQNRKNTRLRRRLLTWIHSTTNQSITMDCLWADFELNGYRLRRRQRPILGNHEFMQLNIKAGWNLLTAGFEVLGEYWSFLLGYPVATQISLHASPDVNDTAQFLVSPLEDTSHELPAYMAPGRFKAPPDWAPEVCDASNVTPARQMAWDEFAQAGIIRNVPMKHFRDHSRFHQPSVAWTFDFDDEYYGHPLLEVEAPEGTVLDIAYDDWLREDGAVALYASNPFTDSADRFILNEGRQTIAVCNPRGGRFMQVVMRAPEDAPGPLTLHHIEVRSRRTLPTPPYPLRTGDHVFDWANTASLHTLIASTDEAYSDSPWRERGSYIGDSYVNIHLHRIVSADMTIARRTLRIFGHAQLPDGQLPAVAPAWFRLPHPDFTLIWPLSLWDYYSFTGDSSLLHEAWPVLQRIWQSSVWEPHECGLWNAPDIRLFIDWGVLPFERIGSAHGALNIFRFLALHACANIATSIGKVHAAEQLRQTADKVADVLTSVLWDNSEGRFRASLGSTSPALHTNILALFAGIGDTAKILNYLEPKLRNNFTHGIDHGQHSGYCELYFFHYLFPALAENGKHELVEDLIHQHYSFLKSHGYKTLHECFSRAHKGSGSCCHSWSGAPAIYFVRYILGLSQTQPGKLDKWNLAPVSPSFNQAEGALPLPNGWIRVHWRKSKSGGITARVNAPAGVQIIPADGVDLTLT